MLLIIKNNNSGNDQNDWVKLLSS